MPPTLNATAGSSSANSYTTRAAANTYFDERLNSATWTAAADADKDRSLIMATRLIDTCFEFEGSVFSTTQALRWPRIGVYTPDGTEVDDETIPSFLQQAVSETALFLLTSDRLAEPGLLGQGFSEAGVGSLKVKVDPTAVLPYIPQHVIALLEPYGTLRTGAVRSGGRTVKVRRA